MYSVRLRLSLGFCLLAFSVLGRFEVRGECMSLQVSGSLYHSNTDGIYLLDGTNFCNNRHIWIQESGQHYLYYVLDGYDGWTVGSWSCYWGNFLISIRSTAEEPYSLSQVWKEFTDEGSVWKNNSALQIRCFDEVKYNSELTECNTTPCQNGGTCLEKEGSSVCSCQKGYYGRYCETAIDTNHCRSSPCLNGASCFDLLNDFQCRCAPGFSGRHCDILTNTVDCNLWPCDEKCASKVGVTCTSRTSEILTIVGFIGIALGLALLVVFAVRSLYLKHCYVMQDAASSPEDFSYKRLESLDSVWSLDKVGA